MTLIRNISQSKLCATCWTPLPVKSSTRVQGVSVSEKMPMDTESSFLRDECFFRARETISPTSPGDSAPILIKSSVAAAETRCKIIWANVSHLNLSPASDNHLSTTLVHPRLARVNFFFFYMTGVSFFYLP